MTIIFGFFSLGLPFSEVGLVFFSSSFPSDPLLFFNLSFVLQWKGTFFKETCFISFLFRFAHSKFLSFSKLGSSYGNMEYFAHEGLVFKEYVLASWLSKWFNFFFFIIEKFNWFLIMKKKFIYYKYGIFIEEARHEKIREIMWPMNLDTLRRTNGTWAQSMSRKRWNVSLLCEVNERGT